jgi:hypothetical protein
MIRTVAMAKLVTQRLAFETADEVLQLHGGAGYMLEYPIQRAWRDARLGPIGGGTDDIMRQIIVPGMAHTGAARAGVSNLTMTAGTEWARAGVRVNEVAPGLVASSGLDTYEEPLRSLIRTYPATIPSGRMAVEAEVSGAVCFLLSPGGGVHHRDVPAGRRRERPGRTGSGRCGSTTACPASTASTGPSCPRCSTRTRSRPAAPPGCPTRWVGDPTVRWGTPAGTSSLTSTSR